VLPLDPVWVRIRLIPLAISSIVRLDEMDGWPRVVWFVWFCAVSYGSPWLGVTYVRAFLGGSDLWMCTSFVKLETYSNDRVLGIGQATMWTSLVEFCVWWFEFMSLSMSLQFRWLLLFLQLLLLNSLLPLLCIFIDHCIFIYCYPGGTCEVRLYPRIYYCVFPNSWPRL
jgi:hypothetical protein